MESASGSASRTGKDVGLVGRVRQVGQVGVVGQVRQVGRVGGVGGVGRLPLTKILILEGALT